MTAPQWPEPPTEGFPVGIPLQTPATLVHALDYRGEAQYVAVYHDGDIRHVTDGVNTVDADQHGWGVFRDHILARQLLDGYELGEDGQPSQHWLLIDRAAGLSVALPADATTLLASQPQTREALTGDMTPQDAARYIATAADVALERHASDTWMSVAREQRAAQDAMRAALNIGFASWINEQIHNLTVSIRDAARDPDQPAGDRQTPRADLDHDSQQPAPQEPSAADTPGAAERPSDLHHGPELDDGPDTAPALDPDLG